MLVQAQMQQAQHQQLMNERQERLDTERIKYERRRAKAEEERAELLLGQLTKPKEDQAAKALKAEAEEALKAEKILSTLRRELERVEMKAHDILPRVDVCARSGPHGAPEDPRAASPDPPPPEACWLCDLVQPQVHRVQGPDLQRVYIIAYDDLHT